MNLNDWAVRWGVSGQALSELLTMPLPESLNSVETEAAIQQDIRLHSSRIGAALWRNNNGAAMTEDGRHLRYGLGNDSKRINEAFKSSDLIGITPVMVTAQHVGRVFGVFTAVEVKRGGWRWSGSEREQAQWKFIQLVNSKGGFSCFAKSVKDYQTCMTIDV